MIAPSPLGAVPPPPPNRQMSLRHERRRRLLADESPDDDSPDARESHLKLAGANSEATLVMLGIRVQR